MDDDDGSAAAISLVLQSAGFHSVRAPNGKDALDVMDAGLDPALIILDLQMPVMDGRAFIQALPRRPDHRAPYPVLIVSAFDAALPGDAVGFLRKPAHPVPLLGMVRKCVGK